MPPRVMEIQTKFHGPLAIGETDLLTVDRPPILGFQGYTRYVLLPHHAESPFLYLQSVEQRDLCFIVADPLLWVPDYRVPASEVADLGEPDEWAVLALCTILTAGEGVTINLRSPLVVARTLRRGGQIVLSLPYPHRFPITLQGDMHCAGVNEKI